MFEDHLLRGGDLHVRRLQLQEFAARYLLEDNKAIATRKIITAAAQLSDDAGHPAKVMMNSLKAVMIGDGYADFTGRGTGAYYVGNHPLIKSGSGKHLGGEGFLPWYSDSGFQVHHVFAALLLGRIPFGETYAKFSERAEIGKILNKEIEWWDIYVYQDFCPLGREVHNYNYKQLADKVYNRLTGLENRIAEEKHLKKQAQLANLPPAEWLTGVQARLLKMGYYKGNINGVIDPATRNSIISFQRDHPPLKPDGVPGPKTQAALKHAFERQFIT